jgi:hypothetical protein
MNALQTFIASKPCGFLRDTDMLALIALDRLCPVLVCCGGCRFTCAAQNLAHLEKCITAGGDYVRDVSFPTGSADRAANWVPEQSFTDQTSAKEGTFLPARTRRQPLRREGPAFNESDCGGAFDGFTVTSDADPGL